MGASGFHFDQTFRQRCAKNRIHKYFFSLSEFLKTIKLLLIGRSTQIDKFSIKWKIKHQITGISLIYLFVQWKAVMHVKLFGNSIKPLAHFSSFHHIISTSNDHNHQQFQQLYCKKESTQIQLFWWKENKQLPTHRLRHQRRRYNNENALCAALLAATMHNEFSSLPILYFVFQHLPWATRYVTGWRLCVHRITRGCNQWMSNVISCTCPEKGKQLNGN